MQTSFFVINGEKKLENKRLSISQLRTLPTNERVTKLELIIQNLERIRSRPDLKNLGLDPLLNYLSPLLSFYKQKISYKQFLKVANYASAETVNEQIDLVVANLRSLLRYLFVEQILEELRSKGVRKELIEEAMTVPDLAGGINKIKLHIFQTIHAFGTAPLDKEVIFKLSVLRIAAHLHTERLKLPDIKIFAIQAKSARKLKPTSIACLLKSRTSEDQGKKSIGNKNTNTYML